MSGPNVLRLCVLTGDWWEPGAQDESCPYAGCDGEHVNYVPATQRIRQVGVERAATVKEIVAALDALGADQDAEPPWDGWISAARFIESRFGGGA